MKQTVDWHSHWTKKSPGFHEAKVNVYLKQYLPRFDLNPEDGVFMPLCGKAHDIHWLSQQGLKVVGVELSQVAIQSFFEEFALPYRITEEPHFTVYHAHNITLYQGDYMHIEASHLMQCKLVYDRAAIVAIESFNRESYVRHMLRIIPENTPVLMVTLEYDQAVMTGPPFSVPVHEIRQYFEPAYYVKPLETNEQIDERPRWRELGLKSFRETALRIEAAAS